MSGHYQLEFSQEDYLDDISDINASDFSNAVVVSADWTAETIIRQIDKGNIVLNPSFQRRDAWTRERKSLFIESMLLNLPVPPLVLAESPLEKGKYIVLDGKQRLLSILQFAAVENRDEFSALKLKSLPILGGYNGMTYEDISGGSGQLANFDNYTIRTSIIKNANSDSLLYQIFYRFNTGSLPLSPQELRFALQPGKFSEFLDYHSSVLNVFRYIFDDDKPDFRMRDAELLLRHIANNLFIEAYGGNLKKHLDNAYWQISDDFDSYESKLSYIVQQLDIAHEFLLSVFGEDLYRKWKKGRFEARFNRSVFEVLVYLFARPIVRHAVKESGEDFKAYFVGLMESDGDFLASFESTTKTVSSVLKRFNGTIGILNSQFGADLELIEIGGRVE
ncbi:DUF262 domain-containing protein [Halomonas saccharevitans]|uniref:GmrSD restriction endonucleases N-terminal domain-containing protein n=1 Tax=Halomonas saccharevitans TaxID=416872 RepID=A0A1I7CAS3_9GAMM|nr:DUF262 domain-containing protein [Halomonas saccharevitans]SFT96512.1 Protein of unknown function DUF262 [Halomonas saccharevitans]